MASKSKKRSQHSRNLGNRPLQDPVVASIVKGMIKHTDVPLSEIAEKYGFKSLSPLYGIRDGKIKGDIPTAKLLKSGKWDTSAAKEYAAELERRREEGEPIRKPKKGKKPARKPSGKAAKKAKGTTKKVKKKKKTSSKASAAEVPAAAAAPAKAAKAQALVEVKAGMKFTDQERGGTLEVTKVEGDVAHVTRNGRNLKVKVARLAKPGSAKKGYRLVG